MRSLVLNQRQGRQGIGMPGTVIVTCKKCLALIFPAVPSNAEWPAAVHSGLRVAGSVATLKMWHWNAAVAALP